MIRFHVFAYGIVQSVGFRNYIKTKANKLNIKGWIKNLEDGRIKAVFEGEENNVNEILEHCKKGPYLAKVDNIIVKKEKYVNEFKDFEIKL
ncbi:acylphosphatase [Candidatus Woesearchaeota archaeon]|nr:acylphosphatase [Candidatus Woesearchaeota archaeon]